MDNGYKCLFCGLPLTGKRKKYCSEQHRQKYLRSKKKNVNPNGNANDNSNINASQLALVENEKLKIQVAETLAGAKFVAGQLEETKEQYERTNAQLIESKEQAAASGAKVEILNSTIKTWQAIAVLFLIAILAMVYILIQSI